MNILATPFRYLDIAFLAFDITGDGEIEAKVSQNKINIRISYIYISVTYKNPLLYPYD